MQNLSSIKTDKSQDKNFDRNFDNSRNSDRSDREDSKGNITDKVQEVAANAAEKVKNVGESIPQVIRQYPLQSLAIGFGVGLLSAVLIGRRASN